MALFRRTETRSDEPTTVTRLIETVAELRATVRALESEWLDMRAQIKKGYQRMERAAARQEARESPCAEKASQTELPVEHGPGASFLRKWKELS